MLFNKVAVACTCSDYHMRSKLKYYFPSISKRKNSSLIRRYRKENTNSMIVFSLDNPKSRSFTFGLFDDDKYWISVEYGDREMMIRLNVWHRRFNVESLTLFLHNNQPSITKLIAKQPLLKERKIKTNSIITLPRRWWKPAQSLNISLQSYSSSLLVVAIRCWLPSVFGDVVCELSRNLLKI